MNLQTSIRVASNNKYTDEQLGIIRRHMVQIVESGDCDLSVTMLVDQVIKLLDHNNVVTADYAMVDVLALQERLADRETRLKAMERAFFEKIVEIDRLKQKLESLEAKV